MKTRGLRVPYCWIAVFCFMGCLQLSTCEVIIKLDIGRIRGNEAATESGRNFYSFRGIPYAEPPSGELRFKPPVPKRSWGDEVQDATREGPICPQVDFFAHEFTGIEDCLVVNVFTPLLPDGSNQRLKPVMVYIHGGAFSFGASSYYGPKKLLDNDIVLVTFNYRLGALGFLSTGDLELPGNYAMLDQVEALKWVNRHVAKFGGDVQRITLFGTSAGAASVTHHMISPLSKGLFQRAIAISASALAPFGHQPDPLVWARKIGEKVGCHVEDVKRMAQCLRDVPAKDLIEAAFLFKAIFFPIVLCPTVDGHFLPDTPRKLYEAGKIHKDVMFVTGNTKNETSMLYAWMLKQNGPRPFTKKEEMMQFLREAYGTHVHNDKAINLMYNRYLEDLDIDDVEASRVAYEQVTKDGLFDMPHYWTAQLMAKAGVKTYAYNYDYEAPFSFNQLFGQKPNGVTHVDDGFMLFNSPFFDHAVFDAKSEKMKKLYQTLLVNIATHGDPTPETTDILPVTWTPVESGKLSVYHVDDPPSIDVYRPDEDPSFKFWTETIPKALEEPKVQAKVEL